MWLQSGNWAFWCSFSFFSAVSPVSQQVVCEQVASWNAGKQGFQAVLSFFSFFSFPLFTNVKVGCCCAVP